MRFFGVIVCLHITVRLSEQSETLIVAISVCWSGSWLARQFADLWLAGDPYQSRRPQP